MAGRHYHLSNGSLFLTWLIAAIIILLLPQDKTSKVWDAFLTTFNPLLKIGRNINSENTLPLNPDEAVTQEKYHQLWKDYQNLDATLRKLHEEYDKLAMVRSNLPRPYGGLQIAQVIGTPGNYAHEVVINKGSIDGIKVEQYVLSGKKNSIVGIVHETSERHAKVRVLTNSNLTIDILIRRNRNPQDKLWVMSGDGKTNCKISNLEHNERVDVGDVVFAATQPSYLNIPIVIGEVIAVEPDEDHPLLWDITVQPVEDMTQLSDVAVIITEDFFKDN